MAGDPFDSARLKIVRAYGHMKAINGEVDAALRSQPNGVVAEIEPESGDKVYRADLTWQPPREFGLLFGDFVHNLRSALDHMVWDLVRLNLDSGDPDSKTEYPIYWDPDHYARKHEAPRKLRGVHPKALDTIEQAQPYHAPKPKSSPLWALRMLDIADKHQTLLLTASVATLRSYGHWGDLPEAPTFGGIAFEDGDEVFRIPARTHAEQRLHPSFTCDIALSVAGPYGGITIRQASQLLYGVVSRHLHKVANDVVGLSPSDTRLYPHLRDSDPVSALPPPCRVIERP